MIANIVKVVGWSDTAPADTYPLESEYLNENYDKCIRAIKDDIIKNKYCFGGDTHQYCPNCSPIISYDGKNHLEWFGFRTWGKIMAEAWNEIEKNEHNYCYMDFYMTNCIPEHLQYKIPENKKEKIRFDGYVHMDTKFPEPTIVDMSKEVKESKE